jgi:RNA polymerase sigma factor (sigma-70 family)
VIRSHVGRRARRFEVLPPHTSSGESESLTERLDSGEDLEATISCRQLIDRALATLSEEVRLLVTLRDVHGLEYHEIASVTGLPIGTVESRVFRARQRLRPLLQPLVRLPATTEHGKRKTKD